MHSSLVLFVDRKIIFSNKLKSNFGGDYFNLTSIRPYFIIKLYGFTFTLLILLFSVKLIA